MVGWDDSASAWIAAQGDNGAGDFTRQFITDPAVFARLDGRDIRTALDVGCGEGRFCRLLAQRGIETVGVDPTAPLLEMAKSRDPEGTYLLAGAEDLPFEADRFDLVISYFTLIDIENAGAALREMARVLKPGGRLIVVNTSSIASAHVAPEGWVKDAGGVPVHFALDHYLDAGQRVESWDGISVRNWHRPLSFYFKTLFSLGLQPVYFDEPEPLDSAPVETTDRYRRAPWAVVMEWQKPQ